MPCAASVPLLGGVEASSGRPRHPPSAVEVEARLPGQTLGTASRSAARRAMRPYLRTQRDRYGTWFGWRDYVRCLLAAWVGQPRNSKTSAARSRTAKSDRPSRNEAAGPDDEQQQQRPFGAAVTTVSQEPEDAGGQEGCDRSSRYDCRLDVILHRRSDERHKARDRVQG